MIAFLAAFVRGFRDAGTLAETRDQLVRVLAELERERFARSQDRHRYQTELRMMAQELAELYRFLSVLSAEQLPEASERKP